MWERPDSALSILNEISLSSLSDGEEKALFALLFTQAQDKNHIVMADDSLISTAVDYYYTRGNDPEKLMLSYYFQGRARYLHQAFPQAIVSFLQAQELAEDLNDKFWIGLTSRGISDTYSLTSNKKEELVYAQKEFDYIKASERQPYVNYAFVDLARAKHNMGDETGAKELINQALDSALKFKDPILYKYALHDKGAIYLGLNENDKAFEIFEMLYKSKAADITDSTFYAISSVRAGKPKLALEILQKISCEDSIRYYRAWYELEKDRGNIDQALYYHEKYFSVLNHDFIKRISTALSSSIVDYFSLEKQKRESDLRNSKSTFVIFILISITVLALITIVSYYIYSKQKETIRGKVILAENLKEMLSESRKENFKVHVTLQELLSSKYSVLESLTTITKDMTGKKFSSSKISEKITDIIQNLTVSEVKVEELKGDINKAYDNWLSDLIDDIPSLKEIDIRLIIFTLVGLSSSTIALLLQESDLTNVYERKRRIKKE